MARVKWNEENLAEIEANKPERQKITEPKTPYHPMISDDDDDNDSSSIGRSSFGQHFEDAMNAQEIPSSVNDEGSSSKTSLHRSGWTSSEDEEYEMDQGEEDSDSERRKCFREHRKVHYDEFHKIKELRREGSHLEEDSDEESSITAGVKDMDIKESSLPANGS
ncbi:hypothetical protein ACS0TY_010339 [Phlomoides rotata]